jgi:hypothetical protein
LVATFSLRLDAYTSTANPSDKVKEFLEFVTTARETKMSESDPSP